MYIDIQKALNQHVICFNYRYLQNIGRYNETELCVKFFVKSDIIRIFYWNPFTKM